MNKYLKYGIMGVVAVALSATLFRPEPKTPTPALRSYEEIIRSGILRAVTEYNSISYHAQADSIVGLHYELLQAFANPTDFTILLSSIDPSIISNPERMKYSVRSRYSSAAASSITYSLKANVFPALTRLISTVIAGAVKDISLSKTFYSRHIILSDKFFLDNSCHNYHCNTDQKHQSAIYKRAYISYTAVVCNHS